MDKIIKALEEVKTAASRWIHERRTGRITLGLNFSQGSLSTWQIGTDETKKE